MLIKHSTYLFTLFAFTSIVVLCLANFPSSLPSFLFAAGSGNEVVAEEEIIHQSAAVESAIRRRGVHVGSSLLTLLCCVLAHMEYTRLEDITEVHILEWKAVVQEAIEGGFKFGFILDYLRRLAHGIFSRRVLAELREAEARVAALRDALNIVAPNPWDLAAARGASAESSGGSALHDLLA
uniref:Uncharacterized protein n=1 Tax=Fagus sylvatica TaxID=28930 RepID=A0A2N9IA46_FAGSY